MKRLYEDIGDVLYEHKYEVITMDEAINEIFKLFNKDQDDDKH